MTCPAILAGTGIFHFVGCILSVSVHLLRGGWWSSCPPSELLFWIFQEPSEVIALKKFRNILRDTTWCGALYRKVIALPLFATTVSFKCWQCGVYYPCFFNNDWHTLYVTWPRCGVCGIWCLSVVDVLQMKGFVPLLFLGGRPCVVILNLRRD